MTRLGTSSQLDYQHGTTEHGYGKLHMHRHQHRAKEGIGTG